MTRPKRNNSSADPASRPKIVPVSPKRKQARSLPPNSSVHDEASIADRPQPDVTDSKAVGSCDEDEVPKALVPPYPRSQLEARKQLRGGRAHVEASPTSSEAPSTTTTTTTTTTSATKITTTLLSLPNELLIQIGHYFTEPDLNRFTRTNRRLYLLLTHRLYHLGKEIEYLDASNLLHWATSRGLVNTVRHLLQQSANPNSKFQRAAHPWQSDGRTPLHIAAENGFRQAATLLLRHGAKTKAWDRDGNTPLHLAALKGHVRMTKALLSAGAKITARNSDGERPLHLAVRHENRRVVKLLLARAGDVAAATDRTGGTALHLAASFSTLGICRLLLNAGADVRAKDRSGATPLHWAAYTGWVQVARLLVRSGADVGARDNDGRIPWHWAGVGGNREVFDFLETLRDRVEGSLEDKNGEKPKLESEVLPLTGVKYHALRRSEQEKEEEES